MHYQLSGVTPDDADALVRHCQFPAMRHDPLRAIMFPQANSESYLRIKKDEEEIKWTIQGLKESLESGSCYLRKITYDSTCVSYAIWTLEPNGKAVRQKASPAEQNESWNTKALDINA
jgi:hypothetical protein